MLKQTNNLIHCITNPISINDCANLILALGAKPIMACHPDEVYDITCHSAALALNLGNFDDVRAKSMMVSAKCAKENKIPLFIAIDQEGGRVNRMPKEIKNLPSANQVAKYGGERLVLKSANIIGKLLHESGYNLNFAPVLDINKYEKQKAIGDRSYSDDKKKVAQYGVATMKELQKNDIISVIKHFPGHGATKQDSHYFLPIINESMKKIESEDMYPFEQAIENGADALLVGHLLIRGVTGIYPASLSRKFITKYR